MPADCVEAMKAVIYSALFGHYFEKLPPMPLQEWPAVCFTDDPNLTALGWDVRVVDRPEATPRLKAKWFKLHPDALFPDMDVSIWIDAGWQVVNPNFAHEALGYLNGSPAVFYPHRWHQNIREELAASTHPKMSAYPLAAQVQCYLDQGLPADAPILECTSIVRKHHDPRVVEMDKSWWWENVTWSECDQLSLPFVLWKTRMPYSRFPFTLAGQSWFSLSQWRAD